MAGVGRMVKESIVEHVNTQLAERPNVFVASVNRLPAPETDAFRQKLHASQARLIMVKRRLGKRAFAQLKIEGLDQLLDGSVGLILAGEDFLATAKVLVEFHKAHEEQVKVRGGVVDGQVCDTQRVVQLANLPPKPVLLAQVVATLEAPIADVIFTIERLIGDIAWVAEQAAAAKPAAPAPAAAAHPAEGGTTPSGEASSTSTPPAEGGAAPTPETTS